jgi:hypothetical protein
MRLRAASMQEETRHLLVKQIQTGVKDALKPNKDFLSAMDMKKPR